MMHYYKSKTVIDAYFWPRTKLFKKWGTNHGEREERGAEGADGLGVRRGSFPPHQGRGL